ncbi:unnamed protein product [Miscanthus lutarioriparius]|uniref:TF-B3 domain-containing protein n=1 Tax=Miscanthus lutarioriparius TaxID=422564 RepID=A0A811SAX0_9POAL|nr:unnamed protein product [Miscanthus lutarioriparius]
MDFLVFKYDGMYRMKVLVFDPSGCEKVPPCFVTKNAINDGRKRKEPIDISSSYANLPMRTPKTKKKALKQRDRSRINISSSRSLSNSSGGMTSSEDDEAHSVPSYMLPRGISLDSMQKKKLKERLLVICSEIPIYVCVVKKSNISGRSQAMSRVLILQCHGKSWEVICRIQVPKAQRKVKRLSKGWARFARDNNLQLGDICLFEPLKTKKYRMNVRIIRKE